MRSEHRNIYKLFSISISIVVFEVVIIKEVKIETVERGNEQIAQRVIDICFDQSHNSLWVSGNYSQHLQRWGTDLGRKSVDDIIDPEPELDNPFSVAVVDKGLLIGDREGIDLVTWNGTRKEYQPGVHAREIVPSGEYGTFIVDFRSDGGSEALYLRKRKGNLSRIYSWGPRGDVECATLDTYRKDIPPRIFFVVNYLDHRERKNLVFSYDLAESIEHKRVQCLGSVETKSKVQDILVHPRNGALMFVTKDGYLHTYRSCLITDNDYPVILERSARPFNTRLKGPHGGGIDYALAASPGGIVYVATDNSPLLKLKVTKKI